MSKGSKRRPRQCSREQESANWDATFGTITPKTLGNAVFGDDETIADACKRAAELVFSNQGVADTLYTPDGIFDRRGFRPWPERDFRRRAHEFLTGGRR